VTIQTTVEAADALTLRYYPILSWSFIAVALYGLTSIVRALADGRQPATGGTYVAMALLAGFTLFVAVAGGAVATARFDRRSDSVRLRRYGLLGVRSEERRLSEVVRLRVQVLRRSQHRVELQLQSGERLPLTTHYVVTFGGGGVGRLAAYLGMEPEIVQMRAGAGQSRR